MDWKRSDLALTLGVLAAYMAAGGMVRLCIPLVTADDWYRSFLWMSGPRLAGFAALLALDRRLWRRTPFSFSGSAPAAVAGHAALTLGLWGIFLSRSTGAPWDAGQRWLGVAGCLLVGVFEEYLFRGVLLDALRGRIGAQRGALASSLLFTVYHVRPQAIAAWPHIFLTGAVFANLRLRGMGLASLALIHALVDASFFFVGRDSVREYGASYWVFLAGLFVYAAATYAPGTTKHALVDGGSDSG